MGISVQVLEYSGQLLSKLTGDHDVAAVGRVAFSDPARYPLVSGVDDHDDTSFNARQAKMLIAELQRITTDQPQLSDTAAALTALAELLLAAPGRPHHRRLVFIGD